MEIMHVLSEGGEDDEKVRLSVENRYVHLQENDDGVGHCKMKYWL